jgi:protoheme IX farnesyltransferase
MSSFHPTSQSLASEPAALEPGNQAMPLWQSLMALFKVRIVILLLFAAMGGAFLAAGGWPGTGRMAILLIAGGLSAAGASAWNEHLERGPDTLMVRTRHRRPLVTGAISQARWVPYVATLMILVPSLAILPFNPALTFFLLAGAVIYIGVYTVWLKPRTPLNIVIGGAAGSAAVLSGSAAAGAWNDVGALILACLVFLWTPTHFWSLAIVYRDDYALGGFPMLPAQIARRSAAFWILLHTSGTALAAMALAIHPAIDWACLIPISLATIILLVLNLRLLSGPSPGRASVLFHASNLYLAIVVFLVCVRALAS